MLSYLRLLRNSLASTTSKKKYINMDQQDGLLKHAGTTKYCYRLDRAMLMYFFNLGCLCKKTTDKPSLN